MIKKDWMVVEKSAFKTLCKKTSDSESSTAYLKNNVLCFISPIVSTLTDFSKFFICIFVYK